MDKMTEDMRRAEYLAAKLPVGSLEADIATLIEGHLDVYVNVDGYGEAYSEVSGVEAAALAIVKELRSRGLVS